MSEQRPAEVRGLVKRYGDLAAVDRVDLTVEPGDVYRHLLSRMTLARAIGGNGWRTLAGVGLFLVAIASFVVAPGFLGPPSSPTLATLTRVHLIWLSAAAASLAAGVVCSAFAWHRALEMCGGRIGRLDCGARYGVGSLVNSLLPGRLGGAVRIALFSRSLTGSKRLWVAGGIPAAIGTIRTALLALLLVAEVAGGVLPAWMGFALGGAGCAVVALCVLVRKRGRGESRLSHLLEIFRALSRSPHDAAWLLGWLACSLVAQLAAVAAVVESLGVRAPVAAALVIVPTLAVTSFAALLPAGIGVTSGAVAVVLHQRGVDVTTALAAGIALNAVEAAIGLTAGIASAFLLAFPTPAARRWTLATVGVSLCMVIAATLGAGPLGELA
jgi:uncharacterized membrane protein YbhN (UPF0104 family)